jgi:alkaline phosphatase
MRKKINRLLLLRSRIRNNAQWWHALVWFGLLWVVPATLPSCKSTAKIESVQPSAAEASPAVILLIGDGMGLSILTAAMYNSTTPLAMQQMPVVGFHKTHSSSDLVTDSAAGATAFACGIKTYNNSIGMGPDTMPCYSLLEASIAHGLATGLVATSSIVHATPAAFYAHEPLRTSNEAIALALVESGVDIFIGGGKRYFDRREEDDRNLIAELTFKGYVIRDYFDHSLDKLTIDPARKFAFFTADSQPVSVSQGRSYLSYATRLSMEYLDRRNPKGFFLLVEGSQIDWANHAKEGRLAVQETLDFDRAVGEALEFARKRGNTLVLVTADHETGGVSLLPRSKSERVDIAYSTNAHTGSMVPLLAFGPEAAVFSGIYENTAIHDKIKAFLGLE